MNDLSELTAQRDFTNKTIASINAEADGIQAYMEQPASLEDPASLNYRLNIIDTYQARLTGLLSTAKDMLQRASNWYQTQNEEELNKLAITVQTRNIKRNLYEFSTTVDRLELMYRTIGSLADDLRTQISFIKSQMNIR